jgi:hypothetical protein
MSAVERALGSGPPKAHPVRLSGARPVLSPPINNLSRVCPTFFLDTRCLAAISYTVDLEMNAGEGLHSSARYEHVVGTIERQYSAVWEKWFAKAPAIPAGLSVRTDRVGSSYSVEKNLIIIGIGESFDLEPSILSVDPVTEFTCAPWMTCLVHEMLHEYEHKVVILPSDQGREFYSVYRRTLQFRFGAGHEERFCTALVTCSEFVGIPPNRLLTLI